MRTVQLLSVWCGFLIPAFFLGACESGDVGGPQVRVTVKALVSVETDVRYVRYTTQEVDCLSPETTIGDPTEELITLSDGLVSGAIIGTLDPTSQHSYAEMTALLFTGCYDVIAQPLQQDLATPSEDCAAAMQSNVEVEAGVSNLIVLISQCSGETPAALGGVTTLNHQPVLRDLNFLDRIVCTGEVVTLCAISFDPEEDPLEFTIETESDCTLTTTVPGPEEMVDVPGYENNFYACWDISCPDARESPFAVIVYDLLADGTRIEDHLTVEDPMATSHGVIAHSAIYSDCDE